MHRTAFAAAVVAALLSAGLVGGNPGIAAAEQGATAAPVSLPFSQIQRRCDFSQFQYRGGGYYARATADVRIAGGEIVADVVLVTGAPNTHYDVKLIQMPRDSSRSCNAGDPGVSVAGLMTDAGGTGRTTVRGPIESWATGVWASVTRPNAFSQNPEEFYTSDMIIEF
ncbi:hypothetical protein [Mycobacterium sp. 236(2023)]|uniref:hypothetical protein n=1 Tax=Mycobacterium sp. 236(2023) TaxID=3038163 RepID=UPI0024153A5D|nr:hypothetical protein [Mycobacterium sp. 236(2023)]MDG4666744.1 hypothetical protein [Mycobacterium sp. 236(2023)]